MPDHEVTTVCPHCGRRNDRQANTDGDVDGPAPGDAAVCIGCDEVAIFGPLLDLRKPTAAERNEVMSSEVYATYINDKKLGKRPF